MILASPQVAPYLPMGTYFAFQVGCPAGAGGAGSCCWQLQPPSPGRLATNRREQQGAAGSSREQH